MVRLCLSEILFFLYTLRFLCLKYYTKGAIFIKVVTKREKEKLIKHGFLRNTHNGYVDKRGHHTGHYKTCGGKIYLEDSLADIAKQL